MTPAFEAISRMLPGLSAASAMEAAGELAQRIPELAPMIGFDQHSPHHAYDLMGHTAHVIGAVPEDLTLRWAALLHDVGKVPAFTLDENGRGHFYGHARIGARMADEILRRLEAPQALRQRVVFLIENHMDRLQPDPEQLDELVHRCGKEAVEQLLALQRADMTSKGTAEHPNGGEIFRRIADMLNSIA